MPKLDGKYLFRDHEITLDYIKKACSNTSTCESPLYTIWILLEKVEDMASIIE